MNPTEHLVLSPDLMWTVVVRDVVGEDVTDAEADFALWVYADMDRALNEREEEW